MLDSFGHGPRVSVIMPVFNGAPYLAEALASIRAQTVPPFQVIVVDDGSTDGSATIAAQHDGVALMRKSHGGIGETLNRGLEMVTGDVIAFLDQDDRWLPDKTALQLQALRANPKLDLVFGQVSQFKTDAEGRETVIDTLRGISKLSLLAKREAFARVGGFSSGDRHDFLDWYARAREIGLRETILPDLVAERRIHTQNFGVKHRDQEIRSYLTALKASLDRRRASPASDRILASPSISPGRA